MILVGIDPGVDTGFAIWDAKHQELIAVESWPIHIAMAIVQSMKPDRPFVIFEDARLRKVFTRADAAQQKYGAAIREGVGSVKRDCVIWEDFLTYIGVPFKERAPVATKWNAQQFQRLTKWKGRTNEHSRDAAMIVYGMNLPMAEGLLREFQQTRGGKRA